MEFDALVIGAGPAGAVTARQLADSGKRVLVLEARPDVGGNTYDCLDDHGVLIHQYGPHIFHTNLEPVYRFLSQFTQWRTYDHRVVANVFGQQMPVPFNLTSLEVAFGAERAAHLEEKLCAAYGRERKVGILELRQATDPELAELADYVYRHVFLHYTTKQWGLAPEEIDPNTTARVPVFLSRDDRYFQDSWQGMPADGYTPLFQRMLDHPNIQLVTNCEASRRLTLTADGTLVDGTPFTGAVVYTGPVDALFHCCYGALPYRTLDFQFEHHTQAPYQTHGTVNYTVDQPYTRITEFKHLTGQVCDGTTIVKEYSKAYTGGTDEIPYYAIINPENSALYQQYATLAQQWPNLHLLGRLAEYQYYNMDTIVHKAMELSQKLLAESAN